MTDAPAFTPCAKMRKRSVPHRVRVAVSSRVPQDLAAPGPPKALLGRRGSQLAQLIRRSSRTPWTCQEAGLVNRRSLCFSWLLSGGPALSFSTHIKHSLVRSCELRAHADALSAGRRQAEQCHFTPKLTECVTGSLPAVNCKL